jgi:siderophore synthetase component
MPYKHLRQSLSKDYWLDANLKLLAKILVEFMYENLIVTEVKQIDTHKYEHILNLDSQIRYTFIASPRIFENWNIDVSSIKYQVL